MLASKVAVLKCHHGIAVKCFWYQDTRPTDPSLVRSLILAVSIAIFQTCFSYYKDKWIAATDYYIYILYYIVLSPLTAVLQSINFTAS